MCWWSQNMSYEDSASCLPEGTSCNHRPQDGWLHGRGGDSYQDLFRLHRPTHLRFYREVEVEWVQKQQGFVHHQCGSFHRNRWTSQSLEPWRHWSLVFVGWKARERRGWRSCGHGPMLASQPIFNNPVNSLRSLGVCNSKTWVRNITCFGTLEG